MGTDVCYHGAECPHSLSPAPGASQPVHIESSSSAIAEGQTLDLNCVVAGSGPTTVTWYKRGGSLPAGHQVGHGERGGHPKILPCPPLFGPDMFPSCAQQVSGSRLRIPQVSAADSGEYVCRVTTGGVTQETSLVVTIDDDAGRSHRECHAVDGDVQTVLDSAGQSSMDIQPPVSRPLFASSPQRPLSPRDRPWTLTAWWPARARPPLPGTSAVGPSQPSTR